VKAILAQQQINPTDLTSEAPASLEDAFIGLTGRY
jgi:hypothetical protein